MNLSEVARYCGVSRSTVSYALSGKRTISDATRQRILAAVDELGYRPPATRRGKQARSGAVALVVPPAAQQLTPMQLEFIGAVMEAAAQANLDLVLSPSNGGHDTSFERIITGGRLDGVILMEIRLDDPRVERLRHSRLPFVTIGRTAHPGPWSWVDLDTSTLVGYCVDHLADLGHRHVALINRPGGLLMSGYAPAHRARDSFAEATARRGVRGVECCCADNMAAGESCTQWILDTHPQVTAIVTVNEAALPGIHRALEHADLDVPSRFSVTGLVGRQWAEQSRPRLTAYDVPAAELGATALRFLREHIARPGTPPRHELLVPAISAGESTGPAAARR
ncbi:MAG TPA: LacI family DNA-binding transcriptional regulator [Actinocrinis sp.]|uniref:LacI family DNA-binding transcriptional regulator n=1 Tax=Actinocrinis sp. TaxID=1920516 RepID=UPI002DDD9C67|nr:LacI family DNA-binding transcriptional regulator [Actinocrinis sp.]HEV2345081.1 LacI family DNA-binding transcriptional regulator [Actinocrinis sp.]